MAFKTRDIFYNADASVDMNNVFGGEPEDEGRLVFVSKRVWKKFDCYTYSCFTDALPVAAGVVVGDKADLKTNYLLEVNKNVKNK